VQRYKWGSHASDSIIRRLAASGHEVPALEEPVAELWMGAHPSGPSLIIPDLVSLRDAIAADAEYMIGGPGELSFLFKVLHADAPLSIQAHPDRELARKLHTKDPANYPDPNHKPELAVCLKDMRALVGFRAVEEIQAFFARLTPLRDLCAGAEVSGLSGQEFLRTAYARLMKAEPESVARASASLRSTAGKSPEDICFLDLSSRYGQQDPGIFAPYFLNLMEFEPGQGIFLGPNEPHSYLGGEILECMASSDNVVRAGLTPKFCDVDTLLSMLTYRTGRHEMVHLTPEANPFYEVPVSDFALRRVHDAMSQGLPGIALVLSGELHLKDQHRSGRFPEGSALFIPAGASVEMRGEGEIYFCETGRGYREERG
jgi:mannose-6-phosphate isomerase